MRRPIALNKCAACGVQRCNVMPMPKQFLKWLRAAAALFIAASPAAFAKVDFQREVRPILSSTCFKCHGPDEGTRKGKLRLDLRDEALKPAKSGAIALTPGDIDKS